jgi:large subunit ribosomal protein L40e
MVCSLLVNPIVEIQCGNCQALIEVEDECYLPVTDGRLLCCSCQDDFGPILLCENEILSLVDISKLVARLARHYIQKEDAFSAVKEFARFVVLKNLIGDSEGGLLSPSPLVDLVWHEMILDTRMYAKFCFRACGGRVLEHDPDGASDENAFERVKRQRLTSREYTREFGAMNKSIWPIDSFYIDENIFSVHLKTLTGKTVTLDVVKDLSVRELKLKLQDKEGIPPSEVRLLLGSDQLHDSRTLLECKIVKDSVLLLVLKLRGC